MKGKWFLVALMAVALMVTGVSAGMAQEKVIKLKFSNPHPMTFSSAPVMAAFCDEVKKRTNGRVEITHYSGGTLTTFPKTYDGVVSGVADIGHMTCPQETRPEVELYSGLNVTQGGRKNEEERIHPGTDHHHAQGG